MRVNFFFGDCLKWNKDDLNKYFTKLYEQLNWEYNPDTTHSQWYNRFKKCFIPRFHKKAEDINDYVLWISFSMSVTLPFQKSQIYNGVKFGNCLRN